MNEINEFDGIISEAQESISLGRQRETDLQKQDSLEKQKSIISRGKTLEMAKYVSGILLESNYSPDIELVRNNYMRTKFKNAIKLVSQDEISTGWSIFKHHYDTGRSNRGDRLCVLQGLLVDTNGLLISYLGAEEFSNYLSYPPGKQIVVTRTEPLNNDPMQDILRWNIYSPMFTVLTDSISSPTYEKLNARKIEDSIQKNMAHIVAIHKN